MARTIVRSLESKKGQDILLLDIQDIAAFTDYFVLCTGTSDRMLEALADAAVDSVHKTYRKRGLKQGEAREGWIVVDYGDVVLHLFSPEQRQYYRLAELWQDGRILLKVQ